MRFPYMKIAIYVLTFITYIYSGYGSNMIATLRDAIIAAEAVFGDVFQNAVTLAKKFKTVHEVFDAAVEENCVFKCSGAGSKSPIQNKFYTPKADGCGSLGVHINTEYLPAAEMETCCNAHDICYDTCNSDKELCDLDFKRCLYRYCDTYEKSVVGDLAVKGCKTAAKMLFTGTLTLGCKSYLDSQQRSCYCPSINSQYQTENKNGRDGEQCDQQKYNSGKKKNEYTNNKKNDKRPPKYGWKDVKDL